MNAEEIKSLGENVVFPIVVFGFLAYFAYLASRD